MEIAIMKLYCHIICKFEYLSKKQFYNFPDIKIYHFLVLKVSFTLYIYGVLPGKEPRIAHHIGSQE